MATETTSGRIIPSSAYFNSKYLIDGNNLWKLKNLLVSDTFFNDVELLFTNPSDYVNSIKMYPLDVYRWASISASEKMKIGKMTADSVYARPVGLISKRVLLAQIQCPKKYNNFLDYDPFTKIELYVPYFSFISLPPSEVMGEIIYIYLSVDFDTGLGTIYIQVGGKVIMTSSAKIGIDIPFGATNLNQVIKDNIANGVKVVAGLVSIAVGGAVGKVGGAVIATRGVTTAVTSGVDAITNSTIRYSRGSASGGTDILASPTSIYLIITRPNALEIDANYRHTKGLPLGEMMYLSQLRGYTVVEDIHLEGFNNSLDEEVTEIENLLKKGVYL